MPHCTTEQANLSSIRNQITTLERALRGLPPKARGLIWQQLVGLRLTLSDAQRRLDECLAAHTETHIRVHVFRMANDDGTQQTAVTPGNVDEWILEANRIFAPARLRLLFTATTDFETRNNTRLNLLFEGTGLQDDVDAIADAEALATSVSARVAVICRTSRNLAAPVTGSCGPGCGFSWFTAPYIIMPAFDPNMIALFGHELGHYLGLPHTFQYVVDTTRDARLVFDLLGQDLQRLENDTVYVSDTPPEMVIVEEDRGTSASITFASKTISFLRTNVMSYYRTLPGQHKTITPQQAARVKQILRERRDGGLGVVEVVDP